MPRVITTLQAMSHPTVVATINCLSEMTQRLKDENDALKKSWVGLTDEQLADVWDKAYRQGIDDERTSEANIGIAGFGAKVNPARENPHRKAAHGITGENT